MTKKFTLPSSINVEVTPQQFLERKERIAEFLKEEILKIEKSAIKRTGKIQERLYKINKDIKEAKLELDKNYAPDDIAF